METNATPGQHRAPEARTSHTVVPTPLKQTLPKNGTQAGRLLAALLAGQRFNPLTGWRQLGIYRLADTAFQLRGLGWPVITGALDVSNRFGEKCRVAEYRLEPEAIQAAGQEAQKFAQREGELREVA